MDWLRRRANDSTMIDRDQIYDPGGTPSFFVDDACTLIRIGSVTHVIFTAREPAADGKVVRTVQARAIIPNSAVQQIGRSMLAAESYRCHPSCTEPFSTEIN